MRSKVAKRIMAETPKETMVFARMYGDLVVRINTILKEKGFSQKDLAEKLDKKPSEISKWLNGNHNFTLRSLAKLEAELGETILYIPQKKSFKSNHELKTSFTVFNNVQSTTCIDYSKFKGNKVKQSKEYANVS